MVSPPGTKGDQAGIWQSLMCLRMLAALSATAQLPRGQEPAEDAAGGKVRLECGRGFGH